MKKEVIVAIISIFLIAIILFANPIINKITGNVVESSEGMSERGFMGPSEADMACMIECTTRGCDEKDMGCRTAASTACGLECGVETEAPKPADEDEECMQKCVLVGCDEFDFQCQRGNKITCEDSCGMVKEPEAKSEEEQCIRDCVAKEDPNLQCGNSQTGETGNAICQKCANECVYLYAGPCFNDEEIRAKEKECETCEHCYGEPIMGDSGQGWDCIVDIKCFDASSEFGDDPGAREGVVAKVGEAVGDFFEGIGNFIGNLSRGKDKNLEKTAEMIEDNSIEDSIITDSE